MHDHNNYVFVISRCHNLAVSSILYSASGSMGPVSPGDHQSTVQIVAAVIGSLLAVVVCVAAAIVIALVMGMRSRREKKAAATSSGREDDNSSWVENSIYESMTYKYTRCDQRYYL